MPTKQEAVQMLLEAGCVHEMREDREGVTRSGWWQDDVFLGRFSDPVYAWCKLTGN